MKTLQKQKKSIANKAPLFQPRPSHVRRLFGAQRDDPSVRMWLEKGLAMVRAKNVERFRSQWGYNVERGCFVDENGSLAMAASSIVEEPVPAFYHSTVVHEERPMAPIFTTFRAPIRRTLSDSPSPLLLKKKLTLSGNFSPFLPSPSSLRPAVKRTTSLLGKATFFVPAMSGSVVREGISKLKMPLALIQKS